MKGVKYILFHVSKFKNIEAILLDQCFKASYCKEVQEVSFNYSNKNTVSLDYYSPMVSFTDNTLDSIINDTYAYGDSAIGMNFEWVKKNGLNPVLYLEKHLQ